MRVQAKSSRREAELDMKGPLSAAARHSGKNLEETERRQRHAQPPSSGLHGWPSRGTPRAGSPLWTQVTRVLARRAACIDDYDDDAFLYSLYVLAASRCCRSLASPFADAISSPIRRASCCAGSIVRVPAGTLSNLPPRCSAVAASQDLHAARDLMVFAVAERRRLSPDARRYVPPMGEDDRVEAVQAILHGYGGHFDTGPPFDTGHLSIHSVSETV
ncbi:hypothetical protein HPB50_021299 [Hyalomma asiaticum]|uniref:Uncharacterized protein n=1 Tax=Hyalomma asiaticum TaxID=266040 RepID=A0ACB7SPW7_HYAAI|nr:hypothetical protein HPB50_021299 [Hyalomma asiaticum]